jgi:hypothetical protein
MPANKLHKTLRLTHHYSGVFFAPALLFFAFTGALQMFGLHESSRGSSYVPPSILVHLSQLHKKGTVYVPPRRPSPAAAAGAKPESPKVPPISPPAPAHSALAEKVFFALTALGLVVSTCTGLAMAWRYTRRKLVVSIVFAAGTAVPLLLLLV